jgi:hypothetical protein
MKLPDFVQVGHMRIAVIAMPERGSARKDADGWFDYQRATIEVWEGLAPQIKAEVLLHEILHAACIAGNTGLEGDAEERVVTGLAPVLLMMLRDNPNLFDAFKDALN